MPDPSLALQLSFLIATSTILFLNSIPAVKSRFVVYGSRATPGTDGKNPELLLKDVSQGWLSRIFDEIATIQVPHGWFLHFYIASVLSSAFWGVQILTRGSLLRKLSENVQLQNSKSTMSVDQVVLVWSLASVQGIRRLLESKASAKHSQSNMFFAHWLLGLAFYLAMGVAIWIEGAKSLISTTSVRDHIMKAPSLRSMLGIPLFLLASGVQHDCHMYLASLPKYTLPMHPIFQLVICPHYTAECLIYLSLAFIGAPTGSLFNRTIFAALIFVSVNLSVTASATKGWYARKFGEKQVQQRWKMIPYMF